MLGLRRAIVKHRPNGGCDPLAFRGMLQYGRMQKFKFYIFRLGIRDPNTLASSGAISLNLPEEIAGLLVGLKRELIRRFNL
jgi:hypothetical protein